MVVGLLLNNWGTWGGSATYHMALVRGLQSRGHQVNIALPFKAELWDVPKDIKFAVGQSASIRAMQASSSWIVWGVGHKLKFSYFIRRKRTRPRIVVINHGSSDNKWSCKCMANESPHADTVVGVSADSLMAIPEPHRSKGRIIYGPVDRDRLAPVVSAKLMRESLGIEPNTKVLLYCGRISPEKRVERAIEAMRYMPEDWKMLVVGASSSHIDPAILYNNFKVQFCGPTLTPGDYLQLANCTISPSNSEGFGLSVIEAMIAGKPTVAHKVGILQELDVGTILPIDSTPSQYAAAVIRATKDAEKASRDQAFLSNMFTVDSFIDQWISIL